MGYCSAPGSPLFGAARLHKSSKSSRIRGWLLGSRANSLVCTRVGEVRRHGRDHICQGATETITSAEDEANKRRWQESGGGAGSADEWRWTLNWDHITDNIIVGSCPRWPEDLDRIVDEAGATAVLSLQCDLCLEALGIDWNAIHKQGVERGIVVSRVPIRDFDHGDQTLMLPEAVRTLAVLLALNNKVYVHCTAGINRATLTTLGYLTFVQGWELQTAIATIKQKRSQAHPYIDCWKSTKARILHGRTEEVAAIAKELSIGSSSDEDSYAHWMEAEKRVVMETFRRQIASSLSLVSSWTDLRAASLSSVCIQPEEMERVQEEISTLKLDLERERAELRNALAILGNGRTRSTTKDDAKDDSDFDDEQLNGGCRMIFEDLVHTQQEAAALKQAIRDIAETSAHVLNGEPAPKGKEGMELKSNADPEVPFLGDDDDEPQPEHQSEGTVIDEEQ